MGDATYAVEVQVRRIIGQRLVSVATISDGMNYLGCIVATIHYVNGANRWDEPNQLWTRTTRSKSMIDLT